MSLFKVTFFLKEEPNQWFPLLLPMHFKWQRDHSLLWTNDKTEFRIVPFKDKGRGKMGYRVHFTGEPDAFQYLFDQTVARFNPQISGIEWVHSSEHTQAKLIQMAEKHSYTRGSLRGIFEWNGVGIVILPTNDIHLQVRNHTITARNTSRFMSEMEKVAAAFLPKPIDLFSFAEVVEV